MANEVDLKNQWLQVRAEFAEQLKAGRIAAKFTMPELVELVGNGLSVNAYKKYEWQGGEQLPSDDRINLIVTALGNHAEGLEKQYRKAIEARAEWKQAQQFPDRAEVLTRQRYVPWPGYSYRKLFGLSLDAIVAHCVQTETEHGKVTGWRHFLEDEDLPITAMASAYGLRVLLMANHAGAYPSVGQIRESILTLELEGRGGWAARTQAALARVETYGPVLHTLRLAGLTDDEMEKRVEHFEDILDPDFDEAAWLHNTVLTHACNTLSNVKPESHRIPELLDALQAAVITDEKGNAYWTESNDPRRASRLSPSVVHTAKAICTVAQAQPRRLGSCVSWPRWP